MGMCSGKCSHNCQHGHEQPFLTCCGLKRIQGWRDKGESAQLLLHFDSAKLSPVDKHVVIRDARSEEEVFGYSIISQESSRGESRQGTPKAAAGQKFALVAEDVIMEKKSSFPHINFESRNGEKLVFLPTRPTTTDLNMYIVTWNMNGKALVRSIAKLLDLDGDRHDLYAIGLQEAHNSVAMSVISEALGGKYSLVSAASMQSLQLFIIARKSVLPFLSRPLVDKISTGGLGGLAGRQKGAVAVTFRFKEVSLLFVACHLAPHEGNVGERNAQYHRISQSMFSKRVPVVGQPGGVFSGCSYRNGLVIDNCSLGIDQHLQSNSRFVEKADVVVWMGDLNYRLDSTLSKPQLDRDKVAFLIKNELEEVLWSKDQLTRALKEGQAFMGYQEGPLSFRPTYKFDVGTDNYDTSSKERVPSWTDRILYKVGDSQRLKVHLRNYNCINSIKSSDHRPVKALMTLSVNNKHETVKYVH